MQKQLASQATVILGLLEEFSD